MISLGISDTCAEADQFHRVLLAVLAILLFSKSIFLAIESTELCVLVICSFVLVSILKNINWVDSSGNWQSERHGRSWGLTQCNCFFCSFNWLIFILINWYLYIYPQCNCCFWVSKKLRRTQCNSSWAKIWKSWKWGNSLFCDISVKVGQILKQMCHIM